MAFLSKGNRIYPYYLATELRVSVTFDDKIIDLHEKIITCLFFKDNEQFVKEMLDNIEEERKSLEVETIKKIEREDKCLAEQRAFEHEKFNLQHIIADQIKKCPHDYKNHFLDLEETE
ncbi:uncharacterized protein TNCV_3852101 [Trichonephila clavipes]|nr:uncharacterized protein TNCV_3852101 [Trichonephila clavipes]